MSMGINLKDASKSEGRKVYSEIGYDNFYDSRGNKYDSGNVEKSLFIDVGLALQTKGFLEDHEFTKLVFKEDSVDIVMLEKYEVNDLGEKVREYIVNITDLDELFTYGEE